jgi:antitoxin HicB
MLFQPAAEGGYVVQVPAMPEICTEGDTLEEARSMAADAIRCVIESNMKRGELIPVDVIIDRDPLKEQIRVSFDG